MHDHIIYVAPGPGHEELRMDYMPEEGEVTYTLNGVEIEREEAVQFLQERNQFA